jgi:hypothetical protein
MTNAVNAAPYYIPPAEAPLINRPVPVITPPVADQSRLAKAHQPKQVGLPTYGLRMLRLLSPAADMPPTLSRCGPQRDIGAAQQIGRLNRTVSMRSGSR